MIDLEKKRKRIEALVKLLALGVTGFFVAPVIFITIKGLLGLIVAAAIGSLMICFAPAVGAKLANWRLKALKAEASVNPIETLENQYSERSHALDAFLVNIKEFYAEIQNFHSEIEAYKTQFPNVECRFEPQYHKMVSLFRNRTEKYKSVQSSLKDFATVIEQKRSEWKVAQAAAKMSKAAGVGEDFLSKLMADTAIDSVQTGLNKAFAELEVSLLDEQVTVESPRVITSGSSLPAFDLELETQPERELVK